MVLRTMPVKPIDRKRPRRCTPIVAFIMMMLGGCPKRFDPRADTMVRSPDAEASREYRRARAELELGNSANAEAEFAAFLVKHPNDPLAPSARLGAARAELALGKAAAAKILLDPLVANNADKAPNKSTETTKEHGDVEEQARYLLGMALHKSGDYPRSRALLRPFVGSIAPGDEAVELHAVLADDAAQLGETEEALVEYSQFFLGARPVEREYVRDRVVELTAPLTTAEVERLWGRLPRGSVAAAAVGWRLGALRRQAGDEVGARRILDETRSAREAAGLAEVERHSDEQIRAAVGCLWPLSGRGRTLGERAIRGALLAAELVPGQAGGVELVLRDSASDPARAVEELAAEGVAAIVGPPDRNEAQVAALRAAALGVPLLELAPDEVPRSELVFKLVRPRQAGAIALVQRAAATGMRTAAILAPDSAYGRVMAQALSDAVRKAQGRVVIDLRYPETATSFVELVRKVKEAGADALFIPAPASQLALIAPQLAASGVVSMAGVKATGKRARLYATADGLNERFLLSTAKYLQGATLAPVFYADPVEPGLQSFLARYRGAYDEDPSSLDALAYDAVRAVRSALGAATRSTRDGVGRALGHLSEVGLTGELTFRAGERAGTPPLYQVEGAALRRLKTGGL